MENIKQLRPAFVGNNYSDFRDMLKKSVERFGNKDAFIVKKKTGRKNVEYKHISYNQFRDDIEAFGTALLIAVGSGKRIAIIGKNRYEWLLSYFTILGGLGVCVPLDKGLPYEELESSLIRSGSEVLIFDPAHIGDVERLKDSGKVRVSTYIAMERADGYLSIEDYMVRGRESLSIGNKQYSELEINPENIDLLLFTSGTTSMAKAVMLSQRNIMANLEAIETVIDVYPSDVSMAFLPYHHTFGAIGQFVMLTGGVTTTYCDGLKYLQNNLVEYKVSVFFCVPLLIESIYKKVMATVKKEGKEKKLAFGMKISKLLLKLGIDVRRKIFKEVLDKLGGNIRLVVSGASAIDPQALEGFKAFGIISLQGYGMTESSPVICVENRFEQKTGSIGRPLPGVDVRIFEPNEEGVGELIAHGDNVMRGYYENEEETSKVLVDGWLHTGDLAYTDEDGFVFICGRKKNVIVLKNGKNVYPEELEVLINGLPYVQECMVFGQEKSDSTSSATSSMSAASSMAGGSDLAICAKIVFNKAYILDKYGYDNLEDIEKLIRADIDIINETLPTYKKMNRLIVTEKEMIKTTTGKVKRFEEANQIKSN